MSSRFEKNIDILQSFFSFLEKPLYFAKCKGYNVKKEVLIVKKLKQLRKAHKLTAKQLAEIINVSESTISLYENGKREPDFKTLLNIANYFNVSVDYLLGKAEEIEKPAQESGTISIRSRDGSVVESELSDEQIDLFKNMLKQIGDKNK